MATSDANSERVDRLILHTYPRPIAEAWRQVMWERPSLPVLWFAAETALRTALAWLLAEQCALAGKKGLFPAWETGRPFEPTFGGYRTLLEHVLDLRARRAEHFFEPDLVGPEFVRLLGKINHKYRNPPAHGKLEPTPEEREQHCREARAAVRDAIDQMSFCARHRLVRFRITDSDDGRGFGEAEFLHGLKDDEPRHANWPQAIGTNRLYCVHPDGSKFLLIDPWMHPGPGAGLYLFHGIEQGERGQLAVESWQGFMERSVTRPLVLREGAEALVREPRPHALLKLRGTIENDALVLRPFEVRGILGQTNHSVVYEVETPDQGMRALKLLKTPDPVLLARLDREYETLQRLDASPRILGPVRLHRLRDGRRGILMPVCRGSLKEHLAEARGLRAPLDRKLVLTWLAQLLEGLAEVHRLGFVHRDVKPSNLLIRAAGEGQLPELVIADFGVVHDPGGDITRTGTLVGSPAYLDPALEPGSEPTAAQDVFAAALVLWEMATLEEVGRWKALGPKKLQDPALRGLVEAMTGPLAKRPGAEALHAQVTALLARVADAPAVPRHRVLEEVYELRAHVERIEELANTLRREKEQLAEQLVVVSRAAGEEKAQREVLSGAVEAARAAVQAEQQAAERIRRDRERDEALLHDLKGRVGLNKEQLARANAHLQEKDTRINQLLEQLAQRNEAIESFEKVTRERDARIALLLDTLNQKNDVIADLRARAEDGKRLAPTPAPAPTRPSLLERTLDGLETAWEATRGLVIGAVVAALIAGGVVGFGRMFEAATDPAPLAASVAPKPQPPAPEPEAAQPQAFEAAPFEPSKVFEVCKAVAPHPQGDAWRTVSECEGLPGRTFACLFTPTPSKQVVALGCREESAGATADATP